MILKKINAIKTYKSFIDFSWSKFCKDSANQEKILGKFSVIFGENGSGKSSVCDILKSYSQTQDFQEVGPSFAELEINDGTSNKIYKYENTAWTEQAVKNLFLFFDVDFINANVHTHGVRSSNLQQGAHTQNAGKLIIDLDQEANNIKGAVKDKKEEIDNFERLSVEVLGFRFSDEEKELNKTYEKFDGVRKKESISKAQEESKKLEITSTSLAKINKQYSEIAKLSEVAKLIYSLHLSGKNVFAELFQREIKEKAQINADATIKVHFEKHKQFIESAKEQIPSDYKDKNCPLCMQPLTGASKVIEYYRSVFDKTYEIQKKKFLSDISTMKEELTALKTELTLLPSKITAAFDVYEAITDRFGLSDVYTLTEKTEYIKKFSNVINIKLDEIVLALEGLKSIDKKQIDVSPLYIPIAKHIEDTKKIIGEFNVLIESKNKKIVEFKAKYSDQAKVTTEINENTEKQKKLQELIDFLKSPKIKQIKDQSEAVEKQKKLSEELKKLQDGLNTYLATTIPVGVIKQMIGILGKFNLTFTFEHIKPAANTKDYSFSFKIKDQKGVERELKNGLSEGERQLISLSFFFAINENLPNKDKTILVFDDPITSLDSPNIKILAELIHKKTAEFAQVIVFTHHPLFFKYLSKCEDPNPAKFGILKNAEKFGGSFIFFDPGFDLATEIQKCSEEISQKAQGGSLSPEDVALKYGQLLRLGVERFIKHDLLMWDKEKSFETGVIANLSISKSKIQKLDENDLEVMTNIYKYCNYSNLLHADKENPSALSELINHITKFVSILDKVKDI